MKIEATTKACDKATTELINIQQELNEFRIKRAALNEVIRKERELEEMEDSHKLQLSEINKEDIHFLNSIANKIHNKEILGKIIWSNYLQKPFNEMINRIFGTNIPKNVIYCIENIDTHENILEKLLRVLKIDGQIILKQR